jgi:phage-related protein
MGVRSAQQGCDRGFLIGAQCAGEGKWDHREDCRTLAHIRAKNTSPECSDLTQRSPIAIGWRGASDRKKLPNHTKFCILRPMVDSKPVEFRGNALDDLRAFPAAARREAGHQLDQIQHGREPDDWKPMNTVGRGVREIRIRDAAGAFRVLYVAKFDDAVYVLHCFQKKTQKTSKADLNLAVQRYRDLLKELGQ